MNIAILNTNRRLMGGVESYLLRLIPALRERGHEVALLYETDEPSGRTSIIPADAPTSWCVSSVSADEAVIRLRDWRPDLIYSHTLANPDLEERVIEVAPAIVFSHGYTGTCISGAKTTKFPQPEPCNRLFGWPCLLHYYPRHCGGWDPITMVRLFRFESRRLALLRRYQALLVASQHMAEEYSRHGLGDRVAVLQLPVPAPVGELSRAAWQDKASHLLFLGRMDVLKGGQLLLDALPQVRSALQRNLVVTLAGEGPALADWRQKAARIMSQYPGIEIQFPGWVDEAQKRELFRGAHLLVMPSLWPEPFGLVGLEAGHHGIPAAAFDVGGISSWLQDGVNGHLAPGQPPSAAGLAEAIAKCLRDPQTHDQLARGTMAIARSFTLDRHLRDLHQIFERVRKVAC